MTAEPVFTKEQLIQSKTYRQYRDVLAVILESDKTYTHKQTRQALQKFFKTPVKNKINTKEE
nr:MAG TPA: hypothetical protein [Siphoviridae sp. ct2ef27]